MEYFQHIVYFVIGAVLGSFYNVIIYRLPRGMSIVKPSSHCPACGTPIRWYNNIPIVSYLLLKGRCAYCGASIPLRYPLVELSSGSLAVLCALKWQEPISALVFYVFFSILLVASLIDWDTFTLPDSLTLGGLAFGLISSLFREDFSFVDSLVGSLSGAVPFLLIYLYYVKLRRFEGLGFGDVKLMAFIGSVGGVWAVAYGVFIGSVLGLLYALPLVIKNRSFQFAVPYGPFLSLGCFLGLIFDLKRFILSS